MLIGETDKAKMASTLSFLVVSVYRRLKELECPCLEGLYLTDPETMQELLCTPSIHRLDILEWLCTRVYPPLQDYFSSLRESQSELKVKEMAKLGFELMLCRQDDLELIKGLSSPQQQLSFMDQLMDVIPSPSSSWQRLETGDSASPSTEESFQSCIREKEEFLRELFSSPHFQAVLNPECNPWPSDIKPLLLAGEGTMQRRSQAPRKSLENVLGKVLKVLTDTSATLEKLKEECSFLNSNAASSDTTVQTLKLAVSDFHQLIAAFSQVYENAFQEHCGRAAPPISTCGPLFQAVHQSLSLCSQELQAISQLVETSEKIVQAVEMRQQRAETWGGSSRTTLPAKISELRQNYKEFQITFQG
ncbi:HAUS augmin-like complex subunit 7 [Rhinatrema bivittatum]|uniref:HAUS augmin-like complex subunit 7 n=1 Tax=Rhinatrema bivittatum TaxID=194408 RepID=UPI00112C2F7A|nr:HAUS augmin-like complex subunit 7 [Rhinatrema bivittatum]XP_029464970.1 HAUS augmin-like complex subunit 7 [Rhinatrema bivittatum]